MPRGTLDRRALDLVAREPQIRGEIRITRRQRFSLAICGDGATNLSGLELRVAEIEVERGRDRAADRQFFVSSGCVGEFVFCVEFVGVVEGGFNFRSREGVLVGEGKQEQECGECAERALPGVHRSSRLHLIKFFQDRFKSWDDCRKFVGGFDGRVACEIAGLKQFVQFGER